MSNFLIAQNNSADSLLLRIKNSKNKMQKALALNDLAWELQYSSPDSMILLTGQSIEILKQLQKNESQKLSINKILKAEADAFGITGLACRLKGDFSQSLLYYGEALKIDVAMGNKTRISIDLGNIGTVNASQGAYTKALSNIFESLRMNESANNTRGIASDLGNIANIYQAIGAYEKALTYNFKVIKINAQLKDDFLLANTLGNIGSVYALKTNHEKALPYFVKALKLNEKNQDKNGIAITLANIGTSYMWLDKYTEALEYFTQALNIDMGLNDKNGIGTDYGSIGNLYLKMKNFVLAEKHLLKALEIQNEIGSLKGMFHCYDLLSQVNDALNKPKTALEYYKKHIAIRDSITNDENTKKQTQLEMRYEFDKKQTADSLKNAVRTNLENQKHQTEIKQQKMYAFGGIIGFLLMLIVALVSFRAFRNKRKANIIIALQKALVEEKQKEILDSIHYAKRIQEALLPSQKYIERNLDRLKS